MLHENIFIFLELFFKSSGRLLYWLCHAQCTAAVLTTSFYEQADEAQRQKKQETSKPRNKEEKRTNKNDYRQRIKRTKE